MKHAPIPLQFLPVSELGQPSLIFHMHYRGLALHHSRIALARSLAHDDNWLDRAQYDGLDARKNVESDTIKTGKEKKVSRTAGREKVE